MKRRLSLITCFLSLLVGNPQVSPTTTVIDASKPRFNILFISADTLRADMLGVNGNKQVKTPHLDNLAAEGVNFTRAYANITTTNPSHASMFSSLFPKDHKTYSNTASLSSKITTFPEILKSFGWHTAGIVNMRWLNKSVGNVLQGVDELIECKVTRKADTTNKWVLKFLDSRKDQQKPFFLFVHYVDTHTPYNAPGQYAQLYYPDSRNPRAKNNQSLANAKKEFPKHHQNNPFVDKWLKDITDVNYVVATNKGSVTWLDKNIGDVFNRLKRNGQWDSTLIVFTSDHGESLGEHGLWFVHGGLFDTTAKVPLILKIPNGPKGVVNHSVVQHVDLMPTLLSQLKLPIPNSVRGQPILNSITKNSLLDTSAFIEHAGGYLNAVVTSRFKYIKHKKTRDIYPRYPIRTGKEELYDLMKDPGETRNLIREKPVVRRILAKLLRKYETAERAEVKPQSAPIDKETLEMLKSLGYL